MLALSLVTVGIYAAIGTFWSLPTSILTGTGAAGGLALSIVQLPEGSAALLFLAGALALGGAKRKPKAITPITSPMGVATRP